MQAVIAACELFEAAEVVRLIIGALESQCRRSIKKSEIDKSARHDAPTSVPGACIVISEIKAYWKGWYLLCLL